MLSLGQFRGYAGTDAECWARKPPGDCSPRPLRCHSGLAHTQYSSWLSVSGRKLFLGLFFQVTVYHLGKSGQDLKQKPWRDDAYRLPRRLPLIQDHLPREVAPNSRLGPPRTHINHHEDECTLGYLSSLLRSTHHIWHADINILFDIVMSFSYFQSPNKKYKRPF